MTKKNRENPPDDGDYALITKALEIISGKWRLSIILELNEDIRRYSELSEQLPAISEKMLAGELKALVTLGVVERKIYAQIPPRVEYKLTTKGRLALPILRQLREVGRLFT